MSHGQTVIPDYKPIADYAVIGDMHTAALIAVRWLYRLGVPTLFR